VLGGAAFVIGQAAKGRSLQERKRSIARVDEIPALVAPPVEERLSSRSRAGPASAVRLLIDERQ